MSPWLCLSLLIGFSLITQRGSMKSRPLVNYFGRKILVQSRLGVNTYTVWMPILMSSAVGLKWHFYLFYFFAVTQNILIFFSWFCRFSWNWNLKIGWCSSQWLLPMQPLLWNFKIKQGNVRNFSILWMWFTLCSANYISCFQLDLEESCSCYWGSRRCAFPQDSFLDKQGIFYKNSWWRVYVVLNF